jgi:hypothetical protein
MNNPMLAIAGMAALGGLCQWLAWRFKLPSILFLLSAGLLVGPVAGIFDPDALLGELLFPIVSISVAIILFEGGYSRSRLSGYAPDFTGCHRYLAFAGHNSTFSVRHGLATGVGVRLDSGCQWTHCGQAAAAGSSPV